MSLCLCFVLSVILSTLVPIGSSPNAMTRINPKGHQRHQAHKRGAEEDHLDSLDIRRSKKRLANDGSEVASTNPAAGLSLEEMFKLKNSGEFDINDAEQDTQVEVKDEPVEESDPPPQAPEQLPSTADPSTAPVLHARSLSGHTPARNVSGDQSAQIVSREDLLDNLLSQDFDIEMTGHAVQQILQDARRSAGTGNELGVAYVEARIDRLQQKGIASSRLAEVIQLFRTSLQDDLDQLSSRIQSMGGVSMPPNLSSTGTTRLAPDQDKHLRVQSNPSAKRPPRVTALTKPAQQAAVNNLRTQFAAFEASHGQSESSDSSSNDGDDNERDYRTSKQISTNCLADDDDYYRDDLDGDRNECTEEERSTLVVYLFYSLYLS